MKKVTAILLFIICVAILIGFNFTSTIYWYTLDGVIVVVNIIAGVLLLKK